MVGLAAVHVGVGGAVDDDVGLIAADEVVHRLVVGNIQFGQVHRDDGGVQQLFGDGADLASAFPQLLDDLGAQLPLAACDDDFHGFTSQLDSQIRPAGRHVRPAGHIQGNFPARVCEAQPSARFAGKFCRKGGYQGTAQSRRVLRTKQARRSRGRGLLFASPLRRAQQKQGTATKNISDARMRAEMGPPWSAPRALNISACRRRRSSDAARRGTCRTARPIPAACPG